MARGTELRDLAQGFGLLSDATRLAMLKSVVDGPKNVTALCKAVGRGQPTVGYHVALLRMGRLVTGIHKGKSMVYVGNKANLKELAAGIETLISKK